jgi:hypothetical protein
MPPQPSNNLQRQKAGDSEFLSIDTRKNANTLKEGVLQDGRNLRLELRALETRKGIKKFLSDGTIASILPNTSDTIIASGLKVETDGTEKIVLVVKDGVYFYNINDVSPLSSKYPFPAGRVCVEGKTQVLQAVNNIYILRGESEAYIDGTCIHSNISGTWYVTVNSTLPHGLAVGDEVILETTNQQTKGNFIVNQVVNTTSFRVLSTFTATPLTSHPVLVSKARPPLVFDGFLVKLTKQGTIDGSIDGLSINSCFPPTSNAFYFRNRIYLKYSRDEIAVSYYLPNENGDWEFDLTIQAFAINSGDEQEIVGFYPWTANKVLVLKTNSIYELVVSDNSTNPSIILAETTVKSLTQDIGCIAKRSMGNVSGSVFFLSQSGIYALNPQIDVNLIANTLPLSRSVQKYIDSIDLVNANKAVGQIYSGRYYLAIPVILDGISRVAVFVYNLNNKDWESIDTYPVGFNIDNIIIARYGSQRKMFFIDKKTGIYLAEELDVDQFGSTVGGKTLPQFLKFYLNSYNFTHTNIKMYAKTRQYDFNDLQTKRYTMGEMYANYGIEGAIQVNVNTQNPDTGAMVDISTASNGNIMTRAFPLRKLGTNIEFELTSLQGRPSVYSIFVEATSAGRDIHSEK